MKSKQYYKQHYPQHSDEYYTRKYFSGLSIEFGNGLKEFSERLTQALIELSNALTDIMNNKGEVRGEDNE